MGGPAEVAGGREAQRRHPRSAPRAGGGQTLLRTSRCRWPTLRGHLPGPGLVGRWLCGRPGASRPSRGVCVAHACLALPHAARFCSVSFPAPWCPLLPSRYPKTQQRSQGAPAPASVGRGPAQGLPRGSAPSYRVRTCGPLARVSVPSLALSLQAQLPRSRRPRPEGASPRFASSCPLEPSAGSSPMRAAAAPAPLRASAAGQTQRVLSPHFPDLL